MQQGSLSEEQYQRIIDQETASLEEQRKALNELAQQREEHNSRPFGNGYQFDSQGNVTNSADVEKWQAETQSINQQFEAQKKIVEESQAALDKFVEAHERLAKSQDNAANTSQKTQEASSQEIKSFEQLTSEIDALEKKISDLQQRKQELLSIGGGFSIPVVPADALANSGLTFGSDKLEGYVRSIKKLKLRKKSSAKLRANCKSFSRAAKKQEM